jgi:uncharacterized membrane protein YtjA (UPF0391 family)
MIRWAMAFLGIAIVGALIGFTGIAREAAVAGKWFFCAGLVLTGLLLMHGPRTVTGP